MRVRTDDLVLGLNTLAAINAANALRPFDRHHDVSVPLFFTGWPTSELPLQALGVHLALNAAALAHGDIRGKRGAAGVGLSIASAAAMLAIHRTARDAGEVYEQALEAELGRDYADRIVLPEHPGPDAADARTPGAARMLRIRRRFVHDKDVEYGPAGRANRLDVWTRGDLPADGRAPVLLQMPGGAWISGNKQGQAYPLMSHLAERGWVCVAMSYRLSPRATWPAQIVDVKRALAWIRSNIAGLGGDPDFVAVTGGSAGGHLSSLAALTPGVTEWQPGFEDADTSVQAAAPFYGAYDWYDAEHIGHHGLPGLVSKYVTKTRRSVDPDLYKQASPMYRVNAAAPPFMISHGTNDSLIPVEQAREFARKLRKVSERPVVYAELPGAQHAFDVFGSVRANLAARSVARFLGYAYGEHVAARKT